MENWPVPQSSKDVERFLGLVNYHCGFIRDFANLAAPLYALTGKNEFKWESAEQESFTRIKKALTSAPVLSLPDRTSLFILDTDASQNAIGAQLSQVQGGQEKVIDYASCLCPLNKGGIVPLGRNFLQWYALLVSSGTIYWGDNS